MARARPRGRWLWTRCPHPPGDPARLPAPQAPTARRLRPTACAEPASQPEDAGPRAPVRQTPPCRAHFGAGLIALRAEGLPFQPAGGPVGAGLEDVSALAVRPHAAPPPMGTWPEEQGSRKGRRCGGFGVFKKRLLTDPSKSETWLYQRIFFLIFNCGGTGGGRRRRALRREGAAARRRRPAAHPAPPARRIPGESLWGVAVGVKHLPLREEPPPPLPPARRRWGWWRCAAAGLG